MRSPLRFLAILAATTPLVSAQQLSFTDVTKAAGLPGDPNAPDHQWMTGGGAAGDFNGDGWQDLFVAGLGKRRDMLFMNNRDGTFTDRAQEYGVAEKHVSTGACVGDYDGDGHLDLFVPSMGKNINKWKPGTHKLYRNNGGAGFTEVSAAAGVAVTAQNVGDGFGACWGDYDLDGDLDLFVTGRMQESRGNCLFANNGDGTFTNVTVQAELEMMDILGFAPVFIDMNGDRYPELLIAADFSTTTYFINDGDGTFTHAWKAEVFGMGQAIGDFDRSGTPDWFVTSVFPALPPAAGNKLFWNLGDHSKFDGGFQAKVHDGAWGWGSTATDFDHDGWEDIAETNGMGGFTQFHHQKSRFYRNLGDRTFDRVENQVNFLHQLDGMGLFDFDYDNDGDRDIMVLTNNPGQMALYRNDLQGPDTNWVKITIDTTDRADLAPNGFGTKLKLIANGQTQYRWVHGCNNYLSQSSLVVHFGLKDASVIDLLEVTWADGTVSKYWGLKVNQHVRLEAP